MSSTSNTSSSGSSAAANTVVVTARDIEFSNYNSSTGKWGNAVMTMMIMDAVTEELEGYDEKVYATFRNHIDPTDIITFSAEIDGLDTRVTTSDSMIASGKYELYKVYGETSGNEYATSSQFYIQVPGKVWDFANDVVEEDVELVSDWFNYGYIKDTNDVVHGVTSPDELLDVVTLSDDVGTATVNGASLTRQDVKEVKITSMLDSNLTAMSNRTNHNNQYFLNHFDNLEHLDIVSARITRLVDNTSSSLSNINGISGNKFNDRFAFPDTLTVATLCSNSNSTIFNQPVYFPDSVVRIYRAMYGIGTSATYNKKIRFSPNIGSMGQYNFSNLVSWNRDIYPLSENVQLADGTHSYFFMSNTGFNKPFAIPSVWTQIPAYFMNSWSKWEQDLIIPEGIVSIGNYAIERCSKLKSITFPSTLRNIGTDVLSYCGSYSVPFKIKNLQNTQVTNIPNGFCGSSCYVDMSEFGWPSGLRTIGNSVFGFAGRFFNFPQDEDGFEILEFPEGLTSIGTNFYLSKGYADSPGQKIKFVMPSTLTSVGAGFSTGMSGIWHSSSVPTVVKADFTKISPSVFADNDTQSFCVSNDSYLMPVEIKIAPGTEEEWKTKLPDIPSSNTDHYFRKINWVEQTTEYGKLVYYPNYTTTWGVSASAGTYSGQDAEIYDAEEFEDWISDLSPAPYISTAGDLRFDSPNGEDLQYVDTNGDTQTIQYGVWEIRGVSLNFDYSASERYVVFNNNTTISTVDQTSTAEVELTSMAQYNSLCMSGIPSSSSSYTIDMTTRITVGADSTVIPIACIKSYEFGTVPTTIPNYFLVASSVESVNMRHADITTIGDGFLCDCGYFNSNVDLTGVTSVGTNFLSKCELFNGTLGDMSSLTAIGTRFLYDCQSFNHPVQLPSAITSLDAFMTSCYAFSYPLDFSHITTIGNSVLYGCRAFNYPLDLSNVTSVGNYFLANCITYNQPVTIANVTTVGESFLRGCSVFNSQVSLPNCTTFGRSFMQYCTIFNQPLDVTNITNCGSGFLQQCKAFNQPLDFSNLTDAGTSNDYGGFLNYCDAFNQPLNLPKIRCFGGLSHMSSFNSDVTFGPDLAKLSMWSFAYNDKMCKTYNFDTVNPNNVYINNSYYNSLFVATNSSTDAYVNGVKIAGTNRSAWMSKCPNNSSGTFTRKLVNAGY